MLECVMSLFIIITIAFIITFSLHNNLKLLNKNNDNKSMLYIAKEVIEDERNYIKYNNIGQVYTNEKLIKNFKVMTLATPTSKYKCYKLKVEVLNNNKNIELSTYVTQKK